MFSFSLFLAAPSEARALSDCKDFGFIINGGNHLMTIHEAEPITLNLKIDPNELSLTDKYKIKFWDTDGGVFNAKLLETSYVQPDSNGNLSIVANLERINFIRSYNHIYAYIYTEQYSGLLGNDASCYLGFITYNTRSNLVSCESIEVSQVRNINGSAKTCYGGGGGRCIAKDQDFTVEIKGLKYPDGSIYSGGVEAKIVRPFPSGLSVTTEAGSTSDGNITFTYKSGTWASADNFNIIVQNPLTGSNFDGCGGQVKLSNICQDQQNQNSCNSTPINVNKGGTGSSTPFLLCDQITDVNLQQQCLTCAGSSQDAGVWTAVGCIKREPTSIAQSLIKIGLGTGGGISLLMTLGAGFMLSSSQGDPKKTNEAKEMMSTFIEEHPELWKEDIGK